MRLQMWRSCVLTQALENLRFLQGSYARKDKSISGKKLSLSL